MIQLQPNWSAETFGALKKISAFPPIYFATESIIVAITRTRQPPLSVQVMIDFH